MAMRAPRSASLDRWRPCVFATLATVGVSVALSSPAPAATQPEVVFEPASELYRLAKPDSALVRRLQGALIDLGLYRGAAHGRIDAATESALRVFKARAGVEAGDEITEGVVALALRHRTQRQLVDRLQTARRDEIRGARQAIVRAERALAPLLSLPVGAREGFVTDRSCTFPSAPARALLDTAFRTALRISRPRMRDWALGDIASVQAGAGLVEAAFVSVQQIRDPRLALVQLRGLIAAWAEAGRSDDALAVAAALPLPTDRAALLVAVARAECMGGDRSQRALGRLTATLSAVEDPVRRMKLHLEAAVIAGRSPHCAGADRHLTAAEAIARDLNRPSDRRLATRLIASALLNPGDASRSMSLPNRPPDDDAAALRAKTAAVLTGAGYVHHDLATLERLVGDDRHHAVVLAEIARSQAASGASDAALTTLGRGLAAAARVESTHARSHAFLRLMGVALDIVPPSAETDAMAELAGSSIEDPGLSATGLWMLAAAKARRGHRHQAAETKALAEQATARLPLPGRVWIHGELTRHLVSLGDADGARAALDRGVALAMSIADDWSRARALAVMAKAWFTLEDAGGGGCDANGERTCAAGRGYLKCGPGGSTPRQ